MTQHNWDGQNREDLKKPLISSFFRSLNDFRRLAPVVFVWISLLLFAACEDPSGVGGNLLEPDGGLESRSADPGSIEAVSVNVYSGQLRYMAIGQYDDALFGDYESIGILKPSIDTTLVGTEIVEDDQFQIRLTFTSIQYGDTTSTARFEVYPLTDVWRGREVRFEDELSIDRSRKLAEFSVDGSETVTVDLERSWIEEYNQYLSNESANRDSIYRNEFPGLAIVPAEETNKVLFARMRGASGEELDQSELSNFLYTPAENGEEENGEEENGDRIYQAMNDWGYVGSRSDDGQDPADRYKVTNTLESILRLETGLNEERLGSKNIVKVQLAFYKNRNLLESTLPPGHSRPEVDQLRIHRVNSDRIGEWIFSRSSNYIANLDEESGRFSFDITDHANAILFDSPPDGTFYLSAQTIQGLVFPTLLYSEDALEELRPHLIITSVNSDR